MNHLFANGFQLQCYYANQFVFVVQINQLWNIKTEKYAYNIEDIIGKILHSYNRSVLYILHSMYCVLPYTKYILLSSIFLSNKKSFHTISRMHYQRDDQPFMRAAFIKFSFICVGKVNVIGLRDTVYFELWTYYHSQGFT